MGGHTAGQTARSPAVAALSRRVRAAQLLAQLAAAAQDAATAEAALAALPAWKDREVSFEAEFSVRFKRYVARRVRTG